MSHMISRRRALRLVVLTSASGVLAACAPAQTPTTTTAPAQPTLVQPDPATAQPVETPASAPAPAPTSASATAPRAPDAQAAPAIAPAASALPTGAVVQGMTAAATQFLAALDEPQRTRTTYAFDDGERLRWHWTTPGNFPRNGLPLREMTQPQKDAAMALLQASLSPTGFQKTLDIMSLQNDLGNDPELYYLTVFGAPGSAEPWAWRWEGHHVSRHFTVKGDQMTVTPFFHGAWPTVSSAGLRAMPREEDAARELTLSLTAAGQSAAVFQPRTLTRHVTWNEARVSPLDPVGVPVGDLTPHQQALVNEIVQSYLGAQAEPIAADLLGRLRAAGLEQVRFGWAGTTEPRRPHYYRLQGPTFLLEFDNSRNGGTHIHSVLRDFTHDFGNSL